MKSLTLSAKFPAIFAAIVTCFLFLPPAARAQQNGQAPRPKPVIFDSDMGPDYDDVGAIAMLHAYADSGYIRILATMTSTKYPDVAGVMETFNDYFNRTWIPVGVPKGDAVTQRDWQHWSDTVLAKYPHAITHNDEVQDAVALYRRALASQPDSSVTIITTGFLTNLSNLLKTGPDSYSPLDGNALVKLKVKQLVSMAARIPSGYEFNVMKDPPASQNVFTNWPTPILISGFEIGEKIKVGLPLVRNDSIQKSPVKDVFRISIPMAAEDSAGRKSWDETAVLVAVKGYAPYYTLQYGHLAVADDGKDTWTDSGVPTLQARLVEAMPPKAVEELINRLIMHQPVVHSHP